MKERKKEENSNDNGTKEERRQEWTKQEKYTRTHLHSSQNVKWTYLVNYRLSHTLTLLNTFHCPTVQRQFRVWTWNSQLESTEEEILGVIPKTTTATAPKELIKSRTTTSTARSHPTKKQSPKLSKVSLECEHGTPNWSPQKIFGVIWKTSTGIAPEDLIKSKTTTDPSICPSELRSEATKKQPKEVSNVSWECDHGTQLECRVQMKFWE